MRHPAGLLLLVLGACDATSLDLAVPDASSPAPRPEAPDATPPIVVSVVEAEANLTLVDLLEPGRTLRVGLDDPSAFGLSAHVDARWYSQAPLRMEVGDGARRVLFDVTPDAAPRMLRARPWDSTHRMPSEDGAYEMWVDAAGVHVLEFASDHQQTFEVPFDAEGLQDQWRWAGHRWGLTVLEADGLGAWRVQVDAPPARIGAFEASAYVWTTHHVALDAMVGRERMTSLTDDGEQYIFELGVFGHLLHVYEHRALVQDLDGLSLLDLRAGTRTRIEGLDDGLRSPRQMESRYALVTRSGVPFILDLATGTDAPGGPAYGELVSNLDCTNVVALVDHGTGRIEVRDPQTGRRVAEWTVTAGFDGETLSRDGRWLIGVRFAPGADYARIVVDLETGTEQRVPDNAFGVVDHCALVEPEPTAGAVVMTGLGHTPEVAFVTDGPAHRVALTTQNRDFFVDAGGTLTLTDSSDGHLEVLAQLELPNADQSYTSGDAVWLRTFGEGGQHLTAIDGRSSPLEARTAIVAGDRYPRAWPARSSLVVESEDAWWEVLPDGQRRRLLEVDGLTTYIFAVGGDGLWLQQGNLLLRFDPDGERVDEFVVPEFGYYEVFASNETAYVRSDGRSPKVFAFDLDGGPDPVLLPDDAADAWPAPDDYLVFYRSPIDAQDRLLAVTDRGLVAFDPTGTEEVLVPGPLSSEAQVVAHDGGWALVGPDALWIEGAPPIRYDLPHAFTFVEWRGDDLLLEGWPLVVQALFDSSAGVLYPVPRAVGGLMFGLPDGRWVTSSRSGLMVWTPATGALQALLPDLAPDRAAVLGVLESD